MAMLCTNRYGELRHRGSEQDCVWQFRHIDSSRAKFIYLKLDSINGLRLGL
jgi:hypothetical protein